MCIFIVGMLSSTTCMILITFLSLQVALAVRVDGLVLFLKIYAVSLALNIEHLVSFSS